MGTMRSGEAQTFGLKTVQERLQRRQVREEGTLKLVLQK